MPYTFTDYLKHYGEMPDALYFLIVSLTVAVLIHGILYIHARRIAGLYVPEDRKAALGITLQKECEKYYELVFSTTSILFFIGIYFLIDFNYFEFDWNGLAFWQSYSDYILLAFIIVSVLFNSLMDRFIIPLRNLEKGERGALRMCSMVYMTVIFLYIKFIYLDDNYDNIIGYFITLVIGRFVYFDATLEDFRGAMRELVKTLPILALVLLSTSLLALHGFSSGYLMRSNGVVLSLFIAHLFLIVEIFLIARTRIMRRIAGF